MRDEMAHDCCASGEKFAEENFKCANVVGGKWRSILSA